MGLFSIRSKHLSLSHIDIRIWFRSPPINKHQCDRCQWNIVLVHYYALSFHSHSHKFLLTLRLEIHNLTILDNLRIVWNKNTRFSFYSKMLSIFRGISSKITPSVSVLSSICTSNSKIHSSASLNSDPKKFLSYNDLIYPPQTEDETPRKAVS